MKKVVATGVVALGLLVGCVAHAAPIENISPQRHPNLAVAQRLSREAFEKISEAQRANRNGMEGHAARAKQLLEQVNIELKLAAEAANRNRR